MAQAEVKMPTATKSKPKPTDAERFPACKSCGKPIDEAPRWTTYGGSGLCGFCQPATSSPLSTVTPTGIAAIDPEAQPLATRHSPLATREKRLPADWGIEIDPEFQAVYRSPYADELATLRADLQAHGCLDPLIVWYEEGIERRLGHKHFGQRVKAPTRTLLDGHTRFKHCTELEIPVAINELTFASRDEARAWIETHQVARRNLSPQERDEVLARAYERELEARKSLCNVLNEGKAADKIAKETKVSPATVKRAVQSQKARMQVAKASGRSLKELQPLTRREVIELAAQDERTIADALAGGIDHWRMGKERASLETTDEKVTKREVVRVPFKKEHRCKASFTLYERADGRWFYLYGFRNAEGGGGLNGIETALYDFPNGRKGKAHKGHADRQTCLQAAAKMIEEHAESMPKTCWPPAARKVLREWRESLTPQPPTTKSRHSPLATRHLEELRREATRHIERYLDTLDDADAWQQSDYLLDALNAWRGRHKPPAKGTRRPK